MKPTKFDGYNAELTKPKGLNHDQCGSLFVFRDGVKCISSWKMNWKERIRLFITGRIWVSVYSGRTQFPMFLTDQRPEMKNGLHLIKKDEK